MDGRGPLPEGEGGDAVVLGNHQIARGDPVDEREIDGVLPGTDGNDRAGL